MAGRPRQNVEARLAAALARGAKVEEAAAEAGISSRTAFRRLEEPAFRALVSEARATLIRGVAGKLAGAGDKAVDTLVALLGEGDCKIRAAAARGVIDYMTRTNELCLLGEQLDQMRQRIEQLERRAEGVDDASDGGPGGGEAARGPAGPRPSAQDGGSEDDHRTNGRHG